MTSQKNNSKTEEMPEELLRGDLMPDDTSRSCP
jgi:hypothetical protein